MNWWIIAALLSQVFAGYCFWRAGGFDSGNMEKRLTSVSNTNKNELHRSLSEIADAATEPDPAVEMAIRLKSKQLQKIASEMVVPSNIPEMVSHAADVSAEIKAKAALEIELEKSRPDRIIQARKNIEPVIQLAISEFERVADELEKAGLAKLSERKFDPDSSVFKAAYLQSELPSGYGKADGFINVPGHNRIGFVFRSIDWKYGDSKTNLTVLPFIIIEDDSEGSAWPGYIFHNLMFQYEGLSGAEDDKYLVERLRKELEMTIMNGIRSSAISKENGSDANW